jgi:hypothetical protein
MWTQMSKLAMPLPNRLTFLVFRGRSPIHCVP